MLFQRLLRTHQRPYYNQAYCAHIRKQVCSICVYRPPPSWQLLVTLTFRKAERSREKVSFQIYPNIYSKRAYMVPSQKRFFNKKCPFCNRNDLDFHTDIAGFIRKSMCAPAADRQWYKCVLSIGSTIIFIFDGYKVVPTTAG